MLRADLGAIQSLLALSNNQIDYATVKLIIDRMVDPDADSTWALQRLDQMVTEVTSMFRHGPCRAQARCELSKGVRDHAAGHRQRPLLTPY